MAIISMIFRPMRSGSRLALVNAFREIRSQDSTMPSNRTTASVPECFTAHVFQP